MREPASLANRDLVWYAGETKCCTYYPQLHNFIVGGVLGDGRPELGPARATLERLLDERVGVSPLGIKGPRSYWLVYEGAPDGFGRDARMRCPLYDSGAGACGIWPYRESTCATWFCKHERGAFAADFWQALQGLLRAVERGVSFHVLGALDVGADAIASLLASGGPEDTAAARCEPSYRDAWGRWFGRERELYRRAAEIATSLSGPEALAMAGAEGRLLAAVVRARQHALHDPTIPERLRPGRFEIVHSSPPTCVVASYRRLDPVEIPHALATALLRFRGGPTAEAVAEIRRDLGVEITPEVLRTLVDFRLLVPAG
jgi:hypothetical protein